MVNWWQWLPSWAQRLLAKIPSWGVEFVSGWLTAALGYGLLWVVSIVIPMPLDLGFFVVGGVWTHGLSLLYEGWFDPNGLEWKDLAQREVGILTAMGVLAIVLF